MAAADGTAGSTVTAADAGDPTGGLVSMLPEVERAALASLRSAQAKSDDYDKRLKALAPKMEERSVQMDEILKGMPTQANVELPKEPKEQPKPGVPEPDPIQAFGSAASILGIIGSMVLKQPISTALNASAAAMKARNAQDWTTYEAKYKEWKDATDLAYRHADWEQKHYADGLELLKTNQSLGAAKISAIAAVTQNDQMRALIESGDFKSAAELAGAYTKLADSIATQSFRVRELKAREEYYRVLAGRAQKPEMIALQQFMAENPEATAEDVARFLGTLKAPGAAQKPEVVATNKFLAEHPDATADDIQKFIVAFKEKAPDEAARLKARDAETARHNAAMETLKDQQFKTTEERKAAEEAERERHNAATEQLSKEKFETANSRKIDQAIINELPAYSGVTPKDLGYISPPEQRQVIGAFASMRNTEKIASFATTHPDSVGLIASVLRGMNIDSLFSLETPEAQAAAVEERINSAVRAGSVSAEAAEHAKELQKMLTTQAFQDASATGGRQTVYLDRVFREIYQQASSLPALLKIIELRQGEADQVLARHKLGIADRADAKDKFDLYSRGSEAYLQEKIGSSVPRIKDKSELNAAKAAGKLKKGDMFLFIQPDGSATPLKVK